MRLNFIAENNRYNFVIVFTKDRGGNGMAHILYLEDDRVIREVVCEYLLLQDYEVDLAVDGQEALVTLTQKKYDVAILDIKNA